MNAVQIIVEQGAVVAAGQGVAAIGAMKWFSEKIFGPSADALGDNLRAYLATRVSQVFAKAGELAQIAQIEPQPIRPGLLARMIIDASSSEEADDITEWWANLFLDASFASTNEHAVFSDIMALIGPVEARCLRDFIGSFPSTSYPIFWERASLKATLDSNFEGWVQKWIAEGGKWPSTLGWPPTGDWPRIWRETSNSFQNDHAKWPLRPTEWLLLKQEQSDPAPNRYYGHNAWSRDNALALEILERAALLAPLSMSFSAHGHDLWVRGIGLTRLGYEFYRACSGARLKTLAA